MYEAVQPVRPVAGYVGGKRNLARHIIARIDQIPHTLYAEAFVGMGGIFFRRPTRPTAEIINDISADVTTLFRILQRHYQQFLDVLKWQLCSRAEFDRLMKIDPSTLTDLERAARFLYLQRTAYSGKVVGRNFAPTLARPSRFDLTKLVPTLEAVHERLTSVQIEQLPYARFIERYDSATALFYLDPPYWGCEAYYGPDFSVDDFGRLRDLLAGLKGRFLMSINDTPQIRAIFGDFNLEEVSLTYRFNGVTPAKELIISGGGG